MLMNSRIYLCLHEKFHLRRPPRPAWNACLVWSVFCWAIGDCALGTSVLRLCLSVMSTKVQFLFRKSVTFRKVIHEIQSLLFEWMTYSLKNYGSENKRDSVFGQFTVREITGFNSLWGMGRDKEFLPRVKSGPQYDPRTFWSVLPALLPIVWWTTIQRRYPAYIEALISREHCEKRCSLVPWGKRRVRQTCEPVDGRTIYKHIPLAFAFISRLVHTRSATSLKLSKIWNRMKFHVMKNAIQPHEDVYTHTRLTSFGWREAPGDCSKSWKKSVWFLPASMSVTSSIDRAHAHAPAHEF